ncbi:MAG: 30S ribosomal protein S18 [Candidatus Omnitrophica bacterium]|nr:30S ribosomal protein S18 [Candidatus Omnitrophota bacterium]
MRFMQRRTEPRRQRVQDGDKKGQGPGGRFLRKKANRFYAIFPERTSAVDYKDTERLAKFLTEKGKITPRRITGLTAKQQRMLARAIRKARYAGLLPFQAE